MLIKVSFHSICVSVLNVFYYTLLFPSNHKRHLIEIIVYFQIIIYITINKHTHVFSKRINHKTGAQVASTKDTIPAADRNIVLIDDQASIIKDESDVFISDKANTGNTADVSPLPFNLRDYRFHSKKISQIPLDGDDADRGDENDDAEDVEEDEEYEYEDYEDDEEYDDEEEDEDKDEEEDEEDDEDYAYNYIVHDNQSDDDDLEKIVEVYSNDEIYDLVIGKIVADDAYYM